MKLHDVNHELLGTPDDLVIKSSQAIAHSYLNRLKREKDASLETRAGDYEKICSVPTVIVEKWLREGFNVYHESPKAIVARLKNEHLDVFVTSKRSL